MVLPFLGWDRAGLEIRRLSRLQLESQDNGLKAYPEHESIFPLSPRDGGHTDMVLYTMHSESIFTTRLVKTEAYEFLLNHVAPRLFMFIYTYLHHISP